MRVTTKIKYSGGFKTIRQSDNFRLYPWDKYDPTPKGREGEHPRDTGVSRWDTALFDIDKFEADQ